MYVNRGRWIVDCPNPECSWAYDGITEDGRTRYLYQCQGDHTGKGCGTPFELVWPPLDEAEEIAELLAARSNKANRNWVPSETVAQLIVENEAHLVGRDLEWLANQGIGVV